MIVRCKLLHGTAKAPAYQSNWAAGMDLHAAIDAAVCVLPGERGIIPLGVALEIPPGYEGQIRPRSGLALTYGTLTSFGTIDADYRGEIKALLFNHGQRPVWVQPGDRVAQLVIAPVQHVQIDVVDDLSATARGAGGFGSTGR